MPIEPTNPRASYLRYWQPDDIGFAWKLVVFFILGGPLILLMEVGWLLELSTLQAALLGVVGGFGVGMLFVLAICLGYWWERAAAVNQTTSP